MEHDPFTDRLALDVRCYMCHALPGRACITHQGKQTAPHRKRIYRAELLWSKATMDEARPFAA